MKGLTSKRGLAPLIHPRRLWALSVLSGLLWSAPVVAAQQAHVSILLPFKDAPAADAPPDALARDPRLDARVTLSRHTITVDDALAELTKQTKVPLAVDEGGGAAGAVAVAVNDVPLRAVLRALAAVSDSHWKRAETPDGRGGLLLMGLRDDPRYWDFNRPHSQGEADEHRAILRFADAATHLPPDVQQALAVDNGHDGVPYASLPPEMQQAAQDALRPELASLADQHIPVKISTENMAATRVSLHVRPDSGTTAYSMNVVGPGLGNLRVEFSQPNDPRLRDETVQPAAAVPWQRTHLTALVASYNAARDRASKDDPRLAQSVSLITDDCSVGYPLVALADMAHVPVVAAMLPQTHSISFGPTPLKEALDQVAAKYRGSWTVTGDGFVVFHTLARSLPGFWTPEELAAQDAAAKVTLRCPPFYVPLAM